MSNVATFTGIENTISACRNRAVIAATVPRIRVAIVAFFACIDDAVSAERTVRTTLSAQTSGGITGLVSIRIDETITASRTEDFYQLEREPVTGDSPIIKLLELDESGRARECYKQNSCFRAGRVWRPDGKRL